jgi:hypothetical protein
MIALLRLQHIAGAVFLALAFAACTPVSGISPPQPPGSELCPVTFGQVPEKVPEEYVETTSLLAQGQERVRLLHPRENGLFVVRVDSPERTPIYGHYRAHEVVTRDYPLSLGLRGLSWRTVTTGSNPKALETEIPPGHYRVMLRYLAPTARGKKAKRQTVCFAISPSFELTRGLISLRVE